MWLLSELVQGIFTQPPDLQMTWFRCLFAISCLIKFYTETSRGYYHYFDNNSYLSTQYHLKHPQSLLTQGAYRLGYVIKIVSALLLLFGIQPIVASTALVICFYTETKIYFKFHTCFFALCALGLGIASIPGEKLYALGSFIIVSTTCSIYFFSAVRKMRSRDFVSGYSIYLTLLHLYYEKKRRHHPDSYYPLWFVRTFILGNKSRVLMRWKCLSIVTIATEFILPILLLNDTTFLFGAALGLGMHVLFTSLMPTTLIHFSTATISTYLLFANPWWLFDKVPNLGVS